MEFTKQEFTKQEFTEFEHDQYFTVTANNNLSNTTGQDIIKQNTSYELVIGKGPSDSGYRRIYLYDKGTENFTDLEDIKKNPLDFIEERHYGKFEELNKDFFMTHNHNVFQKKGEKKGEKKGGKSRRNRKSGKSKRNRKAGKSKRRKSRR